MSISTESKKPAALALFKDLQAAGVTVRNCILRAFEQQLGMTTVAARCYYSDITSGSL